jgi:predicted nucleotide-binding protein
MLVPADELFWIADKLTALSREAQESSAYVDAEAIKKAATTIGQAASGSWMGYHANVYYAGLHPPPAGARFSVEWGLMECWPIEATVGDWREFSNEQIRSAIRSLSASADISAYRQVSSNAADKFKAYKSEVESILTIALSRKKDVLLDGLLKDTLALKLFGSNGVVDELRPKGHVISRDMTAVSQGTHVPPHFAVFAEVIALEHSVGVLALLAELTRKAGSHLTRINAVGGKMTKEGNRVFIGHGHSPLWRELKDFLENRLHLPVDEFNRVPTAGLHTIQRLSEMLDSASFAFLIMTAEDETADKTLQARMNVVHEAGLFQGRLGFNRAIILLEEGCAQFSNIFGLNHIPFHPNNIRSAFEDVRAVLEREAIVS